MEGASRNTFTVLSCTKVAIKNTDLRQDPLNTTKRTLALLLPKKANDNFKKCSFWSVENLITDSNLHTIRRTQWQQWQYTTQAGHKDSRECRNSLSGYS